MNPYLLGVGIFSSSIFMFCVSFLAFSLKIFFILKIIYFVYTKISERRIESQVRKAIKFQTYHQRRSRFKRRTSAKEQKQYEMELGKVKKILEICSIFQLTKIFKRKKKITIKSFYTQKC